MKKILSFLGYFFLSNIVFIFDRITKNLALILNHSDVPIVPGVSLVYVKNRGISWGMFYAHNAGSFVIMSLFVGIIIGILGVYTYKRWLLNQSILGEILVLTGAISNLLDRIVYAGIIDFIKLSYHDWDFPVFNIADIAIVIGVAIMLIQFWRKA